MNEATLLGSFVAVGAGGTLGALLRGIVYHGVARAQPDDARPEQKRLRLAGATLFVNVAGSLVLGFCLSASATTAESSPVLRLFCITGLCGSMTTFSTLCADAIRLGAAHSRAAQLGYLGLHLVLGLGGFAFGRLLAAAIPG